jgi:hypothetical protein
MSDKQPPRVQFNFEPDPVEEEVNEETGETNPNFVYSDEEVSETIDEIVPEVVEKEEIDEEKIFDLPNLAVRPDYLGEEPKAVKQPKLTKKGVPRKPMSEAHKAKLAEARKKAAIVKAQKRKEREEEKAFKKQEKELLEKKKKKDFEKLKREVEEDEPPKDREAVVVKETKVSSGLTKEDLEKAQFEAIAKYELLRKQRKAEKKQAQALEAQKKELMERLKPQAQGYKYRDGSNRWDMCY